MRALLRRLLPRAVRDLLRGTVDTVRARSRWWRVSHPSRVRRQARDPGRPLRLGLLATHFPPEVTGGTYRPAALTKYGAEAGLEIVVVGGHIRQRLTDAGQALAGRIPRNVTVHRAHPSDLRPFDGTLPAFDGGFLDLLETWDAADQAFSERVPDVILATGPPFQSFVAATQLARRYRCGLILDYRDEWTESPHPFVDSGRHDRAWEPRCLRAADRVLFTTESQLRHAVDAFPSLSPDKCLVIPNGWEPDDWEEGHPETAAPGSTAVVSFFGNLGDHAPPDAFMETLEQALGERPDLASRFRFRFVGQKSPAAEKMLASFPIDGIIESDPHVAKRQATREMRGSTALLLLNPPEFQRYIPGKLYDYVAAGPPILVYGEGGEIEDIVNPLGVGQVVPEGDPASLAASLERIVRGGMDPPADRRAAWLGEHTREALAGRMISLLTEIA